MLTEWEQTFRLVGTLIAVMVPIVSAAVSILAIWLENRMYRANDILMQRINGTYVKSEVFRAQIEPIRADVVEIKTDLNFVWEHMNANKR